MKSFIKILFFIFISCSAFSNDLTSTDSKNEVTVIFFERPPYYINNSGNTEGFLIDITKLILSEANLKYNFKEMPSKRILEHVKNSKNKIAIGWLKTYERETEFQFSEPIYQDSPYIVVININKSSYFKKEMNLNEILVLNLKLGEADGFSYGEQLDSSLNKFPSKIEKFIPGAPEKPLKMLISNRFDYIFMAQEELSWFIKNKPSYTKYITQIKIKDAPPGNMRYLLFSKTFDKNLLSKINEAILKVKSTTKYKDILRKYGLI